MKRQSLNLILFSLVVVTVSAAHASVCDGFRSIGYDLLQTKPGRAIHRAVAKTGRLDSIHVTGRSKGAFGHDTHTVELRPGRTWGDLDQYPRSYADIVLDPREVVTALGVENAKKFGYRIVDGKMIIPGPDELNAAIKSFNESLPAEDSRRIALSFYSTEDKITTGREYIKKFTQSRQLPLAREGHLLLHDTSAHRGAAFIPPKIFDVSAERIEATAGLLEWIQSKAPKLARKTRASSKLIERFLVASVDAGSNDLQNTVFHQLAKRTDRQAFDTSAGRLTNSVDDVNVATTVETVRYYGKQLAEKLSAAQQKELATHVEAYVQQLKEQRPEADRLPYGLDRETILRNAKPGLVGNEQAWVIHDAVQDRERDLIRQHTDALNDALNRWTPSPP